MAWSTSRRKSTLPPDWPAIRVRILRRDRWRCQWIRQDTNARCGEHANQVDHIDGHDNDDRNLRALCAWHHQQRSSQQGGQAAAEASERRKNAARRRHPGLID